MKFGLLLDDFTVVRKVKSFVKKDLRRPLVWENPREVLETIAAAGYDGVDLDAEPDRIDPKLFAEVSDMAVSLGLKIPALSVPGPFGMPGKQETWRQATIR